jgi:hypothetical protein
VARPRCWNVKSNINTSLNISNIAISLTYFFPLLVLELAVLLGATGKSGASTLLSLDQSFLGASSLQMLDISSSCVATGVVTGISDIKI